MNRLRRWATPLVTGSFLLLAVTGAMMFFEVASPLARVAHEWLSWVLVIGAALHLVVNARGLGASLRPAGAKLGLAVFAALTLAAAATSLQSGGADPARQVLRTLLEAPLERVAAAAGRTPDELRRALEREGLRVPSGGATLAEVAEANHAHPPHVLAVAFAPADPP